MWADCDWGKELGVSQAGDGVFVISFRYLVVGALLARTCLLKNLAISISRLCFSEAIPATINAVSSALWAWNRLPPTIRSSHIL